MKTFRNEKLGFEIELPEEWSPPRSGATRIPKGETIAFQCGYFEAFSIHIAPLEAEPTFEQTEREFTSYVQANNFTSLQFGRLTAAGKEHAWARYYLGSGEWTKKYRLLLFGSEYAITASCFYENRLVEREQVWDLVVSSFRLLTQAAPNHASASVAAAKASPETAHLSAPGVNESAQQANEHETSFAEIIRLEEKVRDFENAIVLLNGLLVEDPTCVEAYIHLAADSGILKRFRQAELYARRALQLDPQSGRAHYYLACALRDQYRIAEASEEMERALALITQAASKGTIGGELGIGAQLFGWNRNVEQDAINLRMLISLKQTRKPLHLDEIPDFTPLPNGMKTYRNDRHGFAIDLPANWLPPEKSALNFFPPIPLLEPHDLYQFGCYDEAFNFEITPLDCEPTLEDTRVEFTIYARDLDYHELEFGNIRVGDRVHLWARYRIRDQMGARWNKKYMIVFGGIEYSITGTCNDPQWFAKREQAWDAIVSSFRILTSVELPDQHPGRTARYLEQRREINERRLMRRANLGTLYGKAYDAVQLKKYPEARALLEQCLRDDPDHVLAHKEMVVVLKKLGDKWGALHHRREVKRLDPSDFSSRMDLVELLSGFGHRKEALGEVEELRTIKPGDSRLEALKTSLVNHKGPHHQRNFILSLIFLLLIDIGAWMGGNVLKVSWLAAFLSLPALNFLNLSGRWVGLTRKLSDWIMVAIALATVAILYFKGNLAIYFAVPFCILVIAIVKDNALRD